MAALRLFTRSRPLMIIIQDSGQFKSLNNTLPNIFQVHKRWGSYRTAPKCQDPAQYTDYEVTKDPEEWKYVESLLKHKTIPVPSFEKKEYPSGWKPPVSNPGDYPYYIPRTKNYMQPIYLEITFRGTRRVTVLRKIQGDIWKLKSELTKYLHVNTNKPIGVRVNELIGEIRFRGDYVTLVKNWLDEKGF
ncbi:mitochondrial ribosomal protein L49 isoform X1 [Osmia lignaria lignaria]|uniref:mitochondrial ribosomal protein L49 isoform X1 n=1 Tax=Osmia lignaria lignaria TaxID=1437193 RepID=UPI001478630F|nr:probable 39S ribosomal protein L49, mitochondrial [Osmia lignaria]